MKKILHIFIAISCFFFLQDGFALNIQNDAQHGIKLDVKHFNCKGPCMSKTIDSKQILNSSDSLKKGAEIKVKPIGTATRPAHCSVPNRELKSDEYHNVKVYHSKLWEFFGVNHLKCKVEIRNPEIDAKAMDKFVKKMKKN
jgi:hypothetical protein